VVEQRSIGRPARFGVFAAGICAWAFALALTRDVDYVALFGVFPDPWGSLLAAPFQDRAAKFLLALCSGLGMVMLVTDAPRRLKVYGALLAFTAPLYAMARLLANA
jgi:hypothetical protein